MMINVIFGVNCPNAIVFCRAAYSKHFICFIIDKFFNDSTFFPLYYCESLTQSELYKCDLTGSMIVVYLNGYCKVQGC